MADWTPDDWLKLLSGSVTQLGVILGLIAVFVQQWRGQAQGKASAVEQKEALIEAVKIVDHKQDVAAKHVIEAAKVAGVAADVSKSSDEKLDLLIEGNKSMGKSIDTLTSRMDKFETKLSAHCKIHDKYEAILRQQELANR